MSEDSDYSSEDSDYGNGCEDPCENCDHWYCGLCDKCYSEYDSAGTVIIKQKNWKMTLEIATSLCFECLNNIANKGYIQNVFSEYEEKKGDETILEDFSIQDLEELNYANCTHRGCWNAKYIIELKPNNYITFNLKI